MLYLNNVELLYESVEEVIQQGVASVTGDIKESTRHAMLLMLAELHFTKAPLVHGPRGVQQAFSRVTDFSESSLFTQVKNEFEEILRQTVEAMNIDLPTSLRFNDLTIQRYVPCEIGISAHHDGNQNLNFVAIFVLENGGEFCICSDGEGSGSHVIQHEPGDLILLRGGGYAEDQSPPYHLVRNVKDQRTTFTLRQNTKKIMT